MIGCNITFVLAHAINCTNDKVISYIMDGKVAPIKEEHCVPHDLGDPGGCVGWSNDSITE